MLSLGLWGCSEFIFVLRMGMKPSWFFVIGCLMSKLWSASTLTVDGGGAAELIGLELVGGRRGTQRKDGAASLILLSCSLSQPAMVDHQRYGQRRLGLQRRPCRWWP